MSFKKNKYSVLKNKTNKGIGYSFMKGVTESNSEFVVMIPGDGENNPIESLVINQNLQNGLNVHKGTVTHKAVADALNYEYIPPLEALKI